MIDNASECFLNTNIKQQWSEYWLYLLVMRVAVAAWHPLISVMDVLVLVLRLLRCNTEAILCQEMKQAWPNRFSCPHFLFIWSISSTLMFIPQIIWFVFECLTIYLFISSVSVRCIHPQCILYCLLCKVLGNKSVQLCHKLKGLLYSSLIKLPTLLIWEC